MSIDTRREGSVEIVTINREPARNALDPIHNEDLTAALNEADRNGDVRCIVLTGAGDNSFCSGADLKTFLPPVLEDIRSGGTPPWHLGGITPWQPDRTPIVAAVNGHALAGGMELAIAADIRLASPNATFGLAEVKWAIIPGAGGTQRLPRLIPWGPAMEVLLTGDAIDAERACRWGLVNKVVPSDELMEAAVELAARIAARGPLAVRAARRAAIEGSSIGLEAGLQREYELFVDVMRTDDALEGSTAFVEKRIPEYRGR